MNNKKDCGIIIHNNKKYKVEWDSNTQLVWVIDENGYKKNYGDAKVNIESGALNCAKKMLISSGQ